MPVTSLKGEKQKWHLAVATPLSGTPLSVTPLSGTPSKVSTRLFHEVRGAQKLDSELVQRLLIRRHRIDIGLGLLRDRMRGQLNPYTFHSWR